MSATATPSLSTGHDALQCVAKTDGCWNWALVGPDPEGLPLVGGGAGSIDEMRDFLMTQEHSTAFFGLLRLTFGTGHLARTKFIFVHGSFVDVDFATRRAPSKSFSETSEVRDQDREHKPRASLIRMVTRGQAMGKRADMERALSKYISINTTIEVTTPEDLLVDAIIERVRRIANVDSDAITVSQFRQAQMSQKRAFEEAERKAAAEAALQAAMEAQEIARIEVCLVKGREVGLSNSLLIEANSLLQSLKKDKERRLVEQRKAAELSLSGALAAKDVTRLAAAIEEAQALSLTVSLVADAEAMRGKLIEQERHKIAAESALREALAARNEDDLIDCIDSARKFGVAKSLIAEAEQVVEVLAAESHRRLVAEESLREAVAGRSIEQLCACIVDAREVGASVGVIADAEHVLSVLKKDASRNEAARALAEALSAKDPDAIAICIVDGRSAGVPEASIKDAEKVLQCLKEQLALEASLCEAMACKDIERISIGIAKAKEFDIFNESQAYAERLHSERFEALIADAEGLLQKLMLAAEERKAAEAALQEALTSNDDEHVSICIDTARSAGVPAALIEEAEATLRRLQDEIARRATASEALCHALNTRDPEFIADCISDAAAAGVAETSITDAANMLERLKQELAAEAALREAMATEQEEIIWLCLAKVRELNACATLVVDAENLLRKMQEEAEKREAAEARKLASEEALRKAILSNSLECVSSCITAARETDASLDLIRNAEATECRLREEAERRVSAESEIHKACSVRNPELLAACITNAVSAGVAESSVTAAECFLQQLRKELEIEVALQEAISTEDVGTIQDLVAKVHRKYTAPSLGCESEHVYQRLNKEAEERKNVAAMKLSAEASLQIALRSDDMTAISGCIQSAQDASASLDLIREAEMALSALQEVAERRALAESTLCRAINCGDPDELAHCIGDASAAGVAEESIEDARLVLQRLTEQLAAEVALREAMNAEDEQRITSCLSSVSKYEPCATLATDARNLLERLHNEAEERKAAEARKLVAEEALREAIVTNDIERISSCIQVARELGTQSDLMKDAEAKVERLQEEAARRATAEAELHKALNMQDAAALATYIAIASAAGASPELMEDANRTLIILKEKEEAEAALHAALEDREEHQISICLAKARELGLSTSLIADAECLLRKLEEEAEARSLAEAALHEALISGGIETLVACIRDAKSVGVTSALVQLADDKLKRLREEASRRTDAETALRKSLTSRQPELIAACIADASAAGVEETVIKEATSILQRISELLAAEVALHEAMTFEDIGQLSDCIVKARELGLSESLINDAENLLQRLEEELDRMLAAEAALREAMESRDVDLISATINIALDNKVASGLIDSAQILLEVIAEERRLAKEFSLQQAMAARDIEKIASCILDARDFGGSGVLIQRAEILMKNIREEEARAAAAASLHAAIEMGNCEMLDYRIKAARNVGVSSDLLREGQEVLEILEARAQRKLEVECALQSALEARDLESIAVCIVDAHSAGVERNVIEAAESTLNNMPELGALELELQNRMATGDILDIIKFLKQVPTLVRIAVDHPILQDAGIFIEQFHQYTFEIDIPCEQSQTESGQLLTKIVEVSVAQGSQNTTAHIMIEDLDKGLGVGFRIATNQMGIPESCPTLIAGGEVLVQAQCGLDSIAAATVPVVADARLFCIPCLAPGFSERRRTRIDIFSSTELFCSLVPESPWTYESIIQWEWSVNEKSAAGPHGKPSWLQNPQVRVYLETAEIVCVMAALVVQPGGPHRVSLHAVKNKSSMSFNVHAAVTPQRHDVIAAPHPQYQASGLAVCFEISQDILILDSFDTSTPPFFLVPSAAEAGHEGMFEIHIRATSPLRCERVSALPRGVPSPVDSRAATSRRGAEPPFVVASRATDSPTKRDAVGRNSAMSESPVKRGTHRSTYTETPPESPARRRSAEALVSLEHESKLQAPSLPDSPPESGASSKNSVQGGKRMIRLNRKNSSSSLPGGSKLRTEEILLPGANVPSHLHACRSGGSEDVYTDPNSPQKLRTHAELDTSLRADSMTSSSLQANSLPNAFYWDAPPIPLGTRAVVMERFTYGTGEQPATVQFVGETSFAPGIWIGVVTDNCVPRGNDGTVKGQRYFDCAPQHGLFVRRTALVLEDIEANSTDVF